MPDSRLRKRMILAGIFGAGGLALSFALWSALPDLLFFLYVGIIALVVAGCFFFSAISASNTGKKLPDRLS